MWSVICFSLMSLPKNPFYHKGHEVHEGKFKDDEEQVTFPWIFFRGAQAPLRRVNFPLRSSRVRGEKTLRFSTDFSIAYNKTDIFPKRIWD
jgi:hypothetical protein